jgi:hydrogenase expression/formation protein HypC
MCLAIPGKVIKIEGDTATVDYEAEQREASIAIVPDVQVGEYVLVQAKMIVQILPEQEAKDALAAIKEAGERGGRCD